MCRRWRRNKSGKKKYQYHPVNGAEITAVVAGRLVAPHECAEEENRETLCRKTHTSRSKYTSNLFGSPAIHCC